MSTWIDFKELRASLRFAVVLRHYRVEVKVKGERGYALCPLPGHPVRVEGRRTASLSVNLTRGIFQCFGCKASGNALEFCARMEGFDPSDPTQFRKAVLKIVEVFGISLGPKAQLPPRRSKAPAPIAICPIGDEASVPTTKDCNIAVIVNAPLEFELKYLDPEHPYLASRGFTPDTIRHFGLGFCGKGMMRDRVAIPLRDAAGHLIGYAGRLVDDALVSDESPKYLFPGSRERDGKRYEFHKSEFLYNSHRIPKPVTNLIVVEGFASVWWLHQHGWSEVVALMGSSISVRQRQSILNLLADNGRLSIMPDEDGAGENLAGELLRQLAPSHWCRWVRSEPGKQPTDWSRSELAAALA